MNNDRPPASKLRKWLMGNKESTLPGLTVKTVAMMWPRRSIICITTKQENNIN